MGPDWKARDLWRSCSTKRRYAHEGQVRREAHARGLRFYKCRHCEGWHLTSQSRGQDPDEGNRG